MKNKARTILKGWSSYKWDRPLQGKKWINNKMIQGKRLEEWLSIMCDRKKLKYFYFDDNDLCDGDKTVITVDSEMTNQDFLKKFTKLYAAELIEKKVSFAIWQDEFYIEMSGIKYTNEEWCRRAFDRGAQFLGNGVYSFDSIHETDTGRLYQKALKNRYLHYCNDLKRRHDELA